MLLIPLVIQGINWAVWIVNHSVPRGVFHASLQVSAGFSVLHVDQQPCDAVRLSCSFLQGKQIGIPGGVGSI